MFPHYFFVLWRNAVLSCLIKQCSCMHAYLAKMGKFLVPGPRVLVLGQGLNGYIVHIFVFSNVLLCIVNECFLLVQALGSKPRLPNVKWVSEPLGYYDYLWRSKQFRMIWLLARRLYLLQIKHGCLDFRKCK